MTDTKRTQTEPIKLTRAQYEFLRTRYKRTRNVSATLLVKQAVLEAVAMQAQKELDETGYHVGKVEEE